MYVHTADVHLYKKYVHMYIRRVMHDTFNTYTYLHHTSHACADVHTYIGTYVCTVGGENFREVYISRSSRFDQIRESLSREFVNITIQTHNTSTQIAKLKPRKCLFEHEIAKFYSANIFRSTVRTYMTYPILSLEHMYVHATH